MLEPAARVYLEVAPGKVRALVQRSTVEPGMALVGESVAHTGFFCPLGVDVGWCALWMQEEGRAPTVEFWREE